METLKEYVGLVNPHWIAIVATGMYIHLRQICVIGLCLGEKSKPPFDPSYASVLFTFSVLCLLAEYRLWPRTLKEPPIQLLYVYEMLIAALTTDLAERVVWTPLMHAVYCLTQESSKWLLWLNDTIDLGYSSYLEAFAQYMAGYTAPTHVSFCLSLLSFVWMLDATETLDAILDTWANTTCALLLNLMGVQLFPACFANALEDEEGEPLMPGPPITTYIFVLGVYTIVLSTALFPRSFRQPKDIFLILYEFLATAFILEFTTACFWVQIEVLVLITLPKALCRVLREYGMSEIAMTALAHESSLVVVTYTLSVSFLLVALHITDVVDFTVLRDRGVMAFASSLKSKAMDRIWRRTSSDDSCRCPTRRRPRSNNRTNNGR